MEALPWPRWDDIPCDLLGDISGRLHTAADYARLHAVCKHWRNSVPPAEHYPTFLPWLLAPPDANTGGRTARCVLSPENNPSVATEIPDQGRTWVIRAEDGVAFWLVAGEESNGASLVDPLTGSRAATLPPFPDKIASWVNHKETTGTIAGNGTILLYALCPPPVDSSGGGVKEESRAASHHPTFNMALLRRDDGTSWTSVQRKFIYYNSRPMETCCVAYHSGSVIRCYKRRFVRIVPPPPPEQPYGELWECWSMQEQDDHGGRDEERVQSSYLVESRGKLLLACVEIDNAYWKSWECYEDVDSLAKALSVSVYVLHGEAKRPRWVRSDVRSFLADRVLFLGQPCSFAVEATRLGMDAGCAYFLDKRRLYQGDGFRELTDRCRLLKYSFRDGRSEFVEELPAEWTCMSGMWIIPRPAIATSTVT